MSIIISAGISIIYRNEAILLVHPNGAVLSDFYGMPKGRVEEGETTLDAALRETCEEVGIVVPRSEIDPSKEEIVRYTNKRGKCRKRVHVFPYHITDYSEIGLDRPVLPVSMLQREEVDWAGFVPFGDAERIVLFRFRDYIRSLRS